MQPLPEIRLADYQYELPDERIARFPLAERDHSKLMVYQRGSIEHRHFYEITDYLPASTLLVFNNTKVIPARLHFKRTTGAIIEVFLLHPVAPSRIISQAMEQVGSGTWECMIGNQKRWKVGEQLSNTLSIAGESVVFLATLLDTERRHVAFSWESAHSFAEIVKAFGEIPLPPYLKRKATTADSQTYQTVYSKNDGAVAAPTAGLHFTDGVLERLRQRGIEQEFLTLHVGAGTFQPVKEQNAVNHTMHSEQVVYTLENLRALRRHVGHIVAVGTTSMRALESLYWVGVNLLLRPQAPPISSFFVEKLNPYLYEPAALPTPEVALDAVLVHMQQHQLHEWVGETEIFIFPGYRFKLCKGLITNYHQPGSTLLMLISAFVGDDWRRIYDEALRHDYRFLSYGDSSLLLPDTELLGA